MNFIDKVSLQALLHFSLDGELNTKVEVLLSEEYREEMEFLGSLCSGLGLKNSILRDERCFLVVEGETEQLALPILFRKSQNHSIVSAGISLFNTRGNSGARRVVDVLVKEWDRRAVLLLDADAPEDSRRWINKFVPSTNNIGIFMIGEKEFEDAFSDEVWLRTLEDHFTPDNGPWALEEVRDGRRNAEGFGTYLRNLVSRRCRRSVGKPELGVELARSIRPEEIPSILTAVFARASELAAGNPR